jgi:hypothetical protein
MDNEKQRKSKESEQLESLAEEKESEIEDRDETRREDDREQQEDLNQGMQTGTHDASHPGIKWADSYRIKEKPAKPDSKDSDTKG